MHKKLESLLKYSTYLLSHQDMPWVQTATQRTRDIAARVAGIGYLLSLLLLFVLLGMSTAYYANAHTNISN